MTDAAVPCVASHASGLDPAQTATGTGAAKETWQMMRITAPHGKIVHLELVHLVSTDLARRATTVRQGSTRVLRATRASRANCAPPASTLRAGQAHADRAPPASTLRAGQAHADRAPPARPLHMARRRATQPAQPRSVHLQPVHLQRDPKAGSTRHQRDPQPQVPALLQ